jgi:hypothetical protein
VNCFNHPDVPAIGFCKYCQKGLCKECAVDLGHGIACSNHRLEVTALKEIHYSQALFNREKSVLNTVTRYQLLSWFLYCCTIIVLAMGFRIGEYGTHISIFVGVIIFIFGLMTSVDANKLSKSK